MTAKEITRTLVELNEDIRYFESIGDYVTAGDLRNDLALYNN